MWRHLGKSLVVAAVAGASACSTRAFHGWAGTPVARSETVPVSADLLWERVAAELDELGLVIEDMRPDHRHVQLGWLTRPGDGRQYVTCGTPGLVGSASLRPRIEVVEGRAGSEIVISTEARATAARSCQSNGRFEQWLLERLRPAIAAAAAEAGAIPAPE